jgi:hypothetical protein
MLAVNGLAFLVVLLGLGKVTDFSYALMFSTGL